MKDISNNTKKQILLNSKIDHRIDYALKNEEFILYYQPIINTETMTVCGAEALLRWNSSKFGIISPKYFMDMLEHSSMINNVEYFVFMQACKMLKRCNYTRYNEFRISINVSEIQLKNIGFLSAIDSILRKTHVNPASISIELTERHFINPTDNIVNILSELRSRGIKIYIDDFGTKYSSLSYLYMIPIDGIKLDKTFIDMIHTSKKALIVIKNIINLASEIGIDVIAEGVEKREQLMLLKQMKCYKIQGYYFSKPIEISKLTDFLNNWQNDSL